MTEDEVALQLWEDDGGAIPRANFQRMGEKSDADADSSTLRNTQVPPQRGAISDPESLLQDIGTKGE